MGGDSDTALCALYDRDSDSPDRPAVESQLQGTKGGQRHLQWIGDEVQKPSKELRQLGFPLPTEVTSGLWNWEKVWKECGAPGGPATTLEGLLVGPARPPPFEKTQNEAPVAKKGPTRVG